MQRVSPASLADRRDDLRLDQAAAAHLVSRHVLRDHTKQGISSIELGRRLGVTQTTAWKVRHKLKQVMMERDASEQLTRWVEIDDAYLGGERWQARARGGGKDAVHRRGRDHPGWQAGPHQAGAGQRFFQPGNCLRSLSVASAPTARS
jgi:hypothetical protein